jgi:HK97 gp10 family phage protein
MIGDPFETLSGFYEGIKDHKDDYIGKNGLDLIVQWAIHYVPEGETSCLLKSIRHDGKSRVMAGGDPLIRCRKGNTKRDYAWFVEYGTSRTKAQPFMRPALWKANPQIVAGISDSVKVYWKGNSRIIPLSRAYGAIRMASLFK